MRRGPRLLDSPSRYGASMSLEFEAAKKWSTIGSLGGVTLIMGLLLSVLPVVVTGPGAGVIDYLILVGPFFFIVGAFLSAWALVGAWWEKTGHRHS